MSEAAGREQTPPPLPDTVFAPGEPFSLRRPLPAARPPAGRRPRPNGGRRGKTDAAGQAGHYVRSGPASGGRVRDVALAATLRAAALRQVSPAAPPGGAGGRQAGAARFRVQPADLRVKVRRGRSGHLILFVVDASGSMGARRRMVAVKGAVLSLLLDAYQKRDRVGLIAFRGAGAELLAPPTNSVELAERRLRRLPTGGRTPLAAGLYLAAEVLTRYLRREEALSPLLVLVTDGRANAGPPPLPAARALAGRTPGLAALVLDCEQGFVRLGAARAIAEGLHGAYLPLDELRAERISAPVRGLLAALRRQHRAT